MYCPKCGTQNDDNNFKCTKCGEALHDSGRPRIVVEEDNTMGGLIPYKNKFALAAYYVSYFALFPFLGVLIGVVAVFLGIKGLMCAKEHPEFKGKIHAWAGIIMGIVFGGLNLLLVIAFFIIPKG